MRMMLTSFLLSIWSCTDDDASEKVQIVAENQEAIRRLFKVTRVLAGNMSTLPAIFPDGIAPVGRTNDHQAVEQSSGCFINPNWTQPAAAYPKPCQPGKLRQGSFVNERAVGEVDGGKLVLFGPVILVMLPFRFVAALRQQMHAAHHVAGIEILGIDPRQQGHVVV